MRGGTVAIAALSLRNKSCLW